MEIGVCVSTLLCDDDEKKIANHIDANNLRKMVSEMLEENFAFQSSK